MKILLENHESKIIRLILTFIAKNIDNSQNNCFYLDYKLYEKEIKKFNLNLNNIKNSNSKFQIQFIPLTCLFILKDIWFLFNQKHRIIFKTIDISDYIYDAHLRINKIPTMKYNIWFRLKTLIIFYTNLVQAYKKVKKIKPNFMIFSHRIGYGNGIYGIISELLQIPMYTFGGDKYIAVLKSIFVKDYEYRINHKEMEIIRSIPQKTIIKDFIKIEKKIKLGILTKDLSNSYTNNFSLPSDLKEFLNRPNNKIGVYLHAWTDYPNSSISKTYYGDYWKWLEHIAVLFEKLKDYDFIIKEHPSINSYKLRKDYLGNFYNKMQSKNTFLVRANMKIHGSVVHENINIGLTDRGSIAPELVAIYKKPVIYFSDSPYDNFKFGVKMKKQDDIIRYVLKLTDGKFKVHQNEIVEAKRYLCTCYKYLRPIEIEKIIRSGIEYGKETKILFQEIMNSSQKRLIFING